MINLARALKTSNPPAKQADTTDPKHDVYTTDAIYYNF